MIALISLVFVLPQEPSNLVIGELMEPDPVPFSFDTIGWKIVFVLAAMLIGYIGYRLYRNYKNKHYMREAEVYIKTLQQQSDMDAVSFVNAVMFQLKKTALHTFGRPEVAGLYGNEWLRFLDSKVTGCNFIADEAFILDAIYKQNVSNATAFSKETFSNKSINWIRQHAR